jgi:hypothetical protein
MAGERFYTVEEANALLPRLRPLLEQIRERQAALAEDRSLAVIREKAAQNGGGTPAHELSARVREIERDLAQLAELSIILRDPKIGLIDFPHRRQGETVYLCWRLGEPRVEYWHPLETGIAGRQPL